MIEEIPLTVVLYNRVMVGPAACRRFFHYSALELKRAEGIVTHCIGQSFGVLAYPGECIVVFPFALKYKGTFLEAVGQTFDSHGIGSELDHVILKLCSHHASSRPVDVALAVGVDEDARVDTVDTLDRLTHRHERAGRRCRSGNTYLESATLTLGCRGEVEEVLSVLVNAIGRPHRIRIGAYPRHIVLSYYHAVVGPVDKIVGGEYMIIGHAEPFLEALDGAGNVVRWIKIHFSIKNSRRRVGGKLVAYNGVLGRRKHRGQP